MTSFPTRVLVVDDDSAILACLKEMLERQGCAVVTAGDGFSALKCLQGLLPEIIISDLRMPNMSGFEFLSIVRRRFPHIAVLVISGEFLAETSTPGLLVDAFLPKGAYSPEQLFQTMQRLVMQSPIRPQLAKPEKAPLWIPRRDEGYIVATCTGCLRSFPIDDSSLGAELRTVECPSCQTEVQYLVDSAVLRMLAEKRQR